MNDKTVMIMPSNNEGLPFGHLLKCLATVVSSLYLVHLECFCLNKNNLFEWMREKWMTPRKSNPNETGSPLHRENRENGPKKIPVRENTGNLEILLKHRKHMEFGLLKL